MTKVLVIFDANWADEMNIKGFSVQDKTWWEEYVRKYPDKPFTSYVGSNQDITFSNKKEYFESFKVFDITDEEAETLKKFFPYSEYGKIVWNEDFDWDEEEK